jgi:hypothetical protein
MHRGALLLFGPGREELGNDAIDIHEVESFDIRDTEKVGSYDVNEIRFDTSRGQITIATGIPLVFRIEVRRLRVTVTR